MTAPPRPSRLPTPPLSWALAIAVVALVLGPAAVSAASASRRADATSARLSHAEQDARTILDADAALPHTSSEGLAEAAIAALAAAGLDQAALDALSPDTVDGGSDQPAVRRRANLSLRCTLPQLGKLLEVWPRFAPGWTITGVDLSPVQTQERSARGATSVPTPGPLPLRALLTLEGVFAQGGG